MSNIPLARRARPGRLAFALAALALLTVLARPEVTQAQWTTTGNNISNTNTGNVGVGTPTPAVRLAVNGAGANVYNTDAWIENNMHVQGNEPIGQGGGRGRMRLGTAWGYVGLYAEASSAGAANDLVLGAGSGNVRVGPGGLITQNFVVPAGKVGIGTVTPTSNLDVADTSYNGVAAKLVQTNASASNGLYIQTQTASDSDLALYVVSNAGATVGLAVRNTGNVGIGTATPTARLHVAGDIRVDGNISAKYQDVAEWVPSKQQLAAGTVVVLDIAHNNHVTASAVAYDTRVAGVVSAQPGIALGERGEGKALVATTGRVKVRVDATRAPIRVGDLLVTGDTPGVAMRSQPLELGGVPIHRPGTLIGKALEPLDRGTGEILVLLSLQ